MQVKIEVKTCQEEKALCTRQHRSSKLHSQAVKYSIFLSIFRNLAAIIYLDDSCVHYINLFFSYKPVLFLVINQVRMLE